MLREQENLKFLNIMKNNEQWNRENGVTRVTQECINCLGKEEKKYAVSENSNG